MRLSFPPAAREALAAAHPAPDGAPLLTRLWAQAQELVTIRQGDHVLVGDPAAGVLARAQAALDAGDLPTAVTEVATLRGHRRAGHGDVAGPGTFAAGGQGGARRVGCVRLMRRVLLVLLIGAVVLALAWALPAFPAGSAAISATSASRPTPVAALGLLLLFALLYAVFRLLGAAGPPAAPAVASGGRCGAPHRRRRGDPHLLALAAGETGDARREASRARRLLGDTPATLLLAAEAGRLAGRNDEAEAALRALADRRRCGFPRPARPAASGHRARGLGRGRGPGAPGRGGGAGAAWLRHERCRLAVRAGEWSDALALADADAPKAALAVAAAEAETRCRTGAAAGETGLAGRSSLSPAALAYASRLRAAGRERRALVVIRHSWAIAPHPDLADFALAPVSDGLQRMQAAQRLTEANPDHAESRLLLARSALEAGLTGEARRHAEAAAATGLNQRRLWLLLAEIEEAEGGDTEAGRLAQRDALRRAATADPDPTWQCDACHTAHASWHPSCPDCFTVGSLRWSTQPAAPSPAAPSPAAPSPAAPSPAAPSPAAPSPAAPSIVLSAQNLPSATLLP